MPWDGITSASEDGVVAGGVEGVDGGEEGTDETGVTVGELVRLGADGVVGVVGADGVVGVERVGALEAGGLDVGLGVDALRLGLAMLGDPDDPDDLEDGADSVAPTSRPGEEPEPSTTARSTAAIMRRVATATAATSRVSGDPVTRATLLTPARPPARPPAGPAARAQLTVERSARGVQ